MERPELGGVLGPAREALAASGMLRLDIAPPETMLAAFVDWWLTPLSLEQAAVYASLSRRSVDRAIADRELPSYQSRAGVRCFRGEVYLWLRGVGKGGT